MNHGSHADSKNDPATQVASLSCFDACVRNAAWMSATSAERRHASLDAASVASSWGEERGGELAGGATEAGNERRHPKMGQMRRVRPPG